MSVAHLSIVITRRGTTAEDITVKISPVQDDFKITYTDMRSGFTHFTYNSCVEVVRYVEDLFYLLPNDADPFDKIQFNFPCFPEVMFDVVSFNTDVVRKTVRDRLQAVLHNWPENYRVGYLQQAPAVQPEDPWERHY